MRSRVRFIEWTVATVLYMTGERIEEAAKLYKKSIERDK